MGKNILLLFAIFTVKCKPSGTREKFLPNQYDEKDGESGNMRLKKGQ